MLLRERENASTITENHARKQEEGINKSKEEEGKFEGGHSLGAKRQKALMISTNQEPREREEI